MNTSSQTKLSSAHAMLDEDSTVEVRDHNGNVMYIDMIAVVINAPDPKLLIVLAPF